MNANACRRPDEVIAYIVAHHHAYVREALPRIGSQMLDVTKVHGDRHPELYDVADVFARLANDMLLHMEKEERILFPWIVEAARQGGQPPPHAMFGTIVLPILMMEREHEAAGESVALIRELTDGYEPPQDACATYRLWLEELKAFDEDLRAHVHLENNILFPAAARLETRTS